MLSTEFWGEGKVRRNAVGRDGLIEELKEAVMDGSGGSHSYEQNARVVGALAAGW